MRAKEKENEMGLRHETGPLHDPPSIQNTAVWQIPLSKKRTPTP